MVPRRLGEKTAPKLHRRRREDAPARPQRTPRRTRSRPCNSQRSVVDPLDMGTMKGSAPGDGDQKRDAAGEDEERSKIVDFPRLDFPRAGHATQRKDKNDNDDAERAEGLSAWKSKSVETLGSRLAQTLDGLSRSRRSSARSTFE